jgi:hypothetical protein
MAQYPSQLPTLTRVGNGTVGGADDPAADGSATDAVVVVTAAQVEIEAIAATLGINPQGVAATVGARLGAVETAVSGKADSSSTTAALAGKADASATTAALATKADLVGGVLPTSQLPAIAVVEFLGSVASQAAMLALSGQKGDWCIRTDQSKVFVITGTDPTQVGSWTAMSYPSAPVTTVNGQSGAVVLAAADVGAQPSDSDLTAIAALTTTTFGRALLTLADAAALTALGNVFTSSLKGLAPASGGGTSNFLRADGTWAAPSAGGGTTWTTGSTIPADTDGVASGFYVQTGLTDFGSQRVFGPKAGSTTTLTVTTRAHTNFWALITTSAAHGLTPGMPVTISGVGAAYNGSWIVAETPSSTTFTVKTGTSTTESSTASSGSVASAWPAFRLFGRNVPYFSALEHNSANTSLPVADGAWLYGPDTAGWANAAIPAPFTISGTSGYPVFSSTFITGASTTGEAYGLLGTGSGVLQTISAALTAPSEATGKAGVVLASAGTTFGIEVHLRNDNKLYVDRNFGGSITNLYTSSTASSTGTVYVARMGGFFLVVGSAWGCDVRLETGALGSYWDMGLFLKNTNTGRITTSSLRFGAT